MKDGLYLMIKYFHKSKYLEIRKANLVNLHCNKHDHWKHKIFSYMMKNQVYNYFFRKMSKMSKRLKNSKKFING